jgi:hypothetical protein
MTNKGSMERAQRTKKQGLTVVSPQGNHTSVNGHESHLVNDERLCHVIFYSFRSFLAEMMRTKPLIGTMCPYKGRANSAQISERWNRVKVQQANRQVKKEEGKTRSNV